MDYLTPYEIDRKSPASFVVSVCNFSVPVQSSLTLDVFNSKYACYIFFWLKLLPDVGLKFLVLFFLWTIIMLLLITLFCPKNIGMKIGLPAR